MNDEEGMTGRGLQPKYSHRKNARHLQKMSAAARGLAPNNESSLRQQASSHLVSTEKQFKNYANMTENTFSSKNLEAVGSKKNIHEGDKHP